MSEASRSTLLSERVLGCLVLCQKLGIQSELHQLLACLTWI